MGRAEETLNQCHARTVSAPVSGRINNGFSRAITIAVFAILMLSAGTAHAQFWFPPWPGQSTPFKHKHHHRQTNSGSAKSVRPEDTAKGPLLVIVSIADQRVSLFDNGGLLARSPGPTGTQTHPPPAA